MGAHIERLELLERVGLLRDAHAGAYHRIQVDQDTVTQQVIDLLLPDPVARGQTQQGRLLIGRVVIDVQVGMGDPTLREVGQEVGEGLLLLAPIMRPKRSEERWLVRDRRLDDAEEVLQAPLLGARLAPHGITLEVEEDVPRARCRQGGKCLRVDDLRADGPGARLVELQAGLGAQPRQQRVRDVRDRSRALGELAHRRHAVGQQALALEGVDPGDQQHILAGPQLEVTGRAPAARVAARCSPLGGHPAVLVAIEQFEESVAASHCHGHYDVERELAAVPIAEDQHGRRRDRHVVGAQSLGIQRQLQQARHGLCPGQLGVPHLPAPGVVSDHEVGEPEKAVIGEGRLIDDVDVRGQRGRS